MLTGKTQFAIIATIAVLMVLGQAMEIISAFESTRPISGSGHIVYSYNGFTVRGIQWVREVSYATTTATASLEALRLAIPRCNYVYLDVWVDADETSDTVQPRTSMESEYITAVEKAKQSGYAVILRVRHNPRPWTGYFPTNTAEWWRTYTNAVVYWASLAERTQVEAFGIGGELLEWETAMYNNDWDNLIDQVRGNYSGKVWYNTNFWYLRSGESDSLEQKLALSWFGRLDYIGVSSYWELSNTAEPSVEDLVDNWYCYVKSDGGTKRWLVENIVEDNLKVLSEFHKRPVLLVGGLASAQNACQTPWAYGSAYGDVEISLNEQEKWYEAFFQVFSNRSWVIGCVFDGAWWTRVPADNPNEKQYSIQNKPAEQTVSYWFDKLI